MPYGRKGIREIKYGFSHILTQAARQNCVFKIARGEIAIFFLSMTATFKIYFVKGTNIFCGMREELLWRR